MSLISAEEESLFNALRRHSDGAHRTLTLEEVHAIKQMFSRMDSDQSGSVGVQRVEELLLRIGDEAAHKVLTSVVATGLSHLTFQQLVEAIRTGLSHEEGKRLMQIESEYIESMGIDREELAKIESFKASKSDRMSFMAEKRRHGDTPGNGNGSRRTSIGDGGDSSQNASSTKYNESFARRASLPVVPRRPSAANDVECYKEEFGFLGDDLVVV